MKTNELQFEQSLLSVVIPVYNVAPCLSKCIDSVLQQTYTNIEIIIVDDGSTDGSGQICDEFDRKNKQITVFHVEHGGTSRARNIGVCNARGEYIGFVDGDDFVDLDMYEDMLREMKSSVDIVTCGRYIIYPKEKHRSNGLAYFCSKAVTMNNVEAVEELLKCKNKRFSFSVCDKVFRRKLFDNVLFPVGRTCEDLPVSYTLFTKSRNIVHIGAPKYYNYHRDGSSSRRDFFYRRVDQALFAGEIYKDVAGRYPHLTMQAEALYVEYIFYTIRCIKTCSHRLKYQAVEKKLRKALLHMSIRILCNPCIERGKKWVYLSEIPANHK